MGLQEDAKKLLPFVQAMADGWVVEWKNFGGRFCEVSELDELFITREEGPKTVDETLRIKPQPTYRPYTRDECVEHCLGKIVAHTEWKSVMFITAVTDMVVYNGMDMSGRSFEWLLAKCTHLDGSPCGMKEDDSARSY